MADEGRWGSGQWQRENSTASVLNFSDREGALFGCWPERDSAATVEERGQGCHGHDKAWWGLEHGLPVPDWGTRALRSAAVRTTAHAMFR